jgi:hypothetical protein
LAINVYIQLDSTKAFGPGPYNIYYRGLNNNLVFLEGPLTTSELIAGQNYSIPDNIQVISLKSINPACNGFIKDVAISSFPSPTPTPTITPSITITPTVTPSITITPTPTLTPTPFLSPQATPTVTPSITVSPTVTPSITVSPTVTPTRTPSITPSIALSPTPTLTPTITPTPSKPQISVTVNLTIDSGNTGYTQIYNNNTGNLLFSMNTNGSTYTFSLTSGISYRVETVIQSRIFSTNVAQINNYVNGIADAGSPYISSILNTPAIIAPTQVNSGDSYTVNTFVGAQRPV